MTILTRLVLNLPLFVSAVAGVCLQAGLPLIVGWGLFVLAAVMQTTLFLRNR